MKHSNVVKIIITLSLVVISFLVVLGVFFHHQASDDAQYGEVSLSSFADVEWNITDDLPKELPVYTTVSSKKAEELWRNILRYCGLDDFIEYEKGIYFTANKWEISVDNFDRVSCWNKNQSYRTDISSDTELSLEEMEERAYAFFEELGFSRDRYYCSARGIEPEYGSNTLYFSYQLDQYQADEYSHVLFVSFLGEDIIDFSVRCEEIGLYGRVTPLSMITLKEQIKDITFFPVNDGATEKDVIRKIVITGYELLYDRVDEDAHDLFVPYIRLMGETEDLGAVVSRQIKAFDGVYFTDPISDARVEISENVKELYRYAVNMLKNREYSYAKRALGEIVDYAERSAEVFPEVVLYEYASYLYSALVDLCLENYYSAATRLEECNAFFDEHTDTEISFFSPERMSKLRAYTKLALSHINAYYEKPDAAKAYLAEAAEVLNGISPDTYTRLFYEYERTNLSPETAEGLEKEITHWDENRSEEERDECVYYVPLLKIALARAYIRTEPEKAFDLIVNDLMGQEADFGTSPEEKLHILAETYTVYAEYLEATDSDLYQKEILSYRRTAASLYESLMLTHYNRLVVDGRYYKQTGEAYYALATLYAGIGQTDAALGTLEYALDYLLEINPEGHDTLCDALALAEELCTRAGDKEGASKYASKLVYYRDVLPKALAEIHPIDLSGIVG